MKQIQCIYKTKGGNSTLDWRLFKFSFGIIFSMCMCLQDLLFALINFSFNQKVFVSQMCYFVDKLVTIASNDGWIFFGTKEMFWWKLDREGKNP